MAARTHRLIGSIRRRVRRRRRALGAAVGADARRRRRPAKPVFADGQAQIVPGVSRIARSGSSRSCGSKPSSTRTATARRIGCSSTSRGQKQTDSEGLEGAGDLRVVAVLRRHVGAAPVSLGREAGSRRGAAEAHVAAGDRVQGRSRERVELARRRPGCRAALRSCIRKRRAPGCSTGCPTVGNDPEILAPKAVIDWLNGRAKGFTTRGRHDRSVARRRGRPAKSA